MSWKTVKLGEIVENFSVRAKNLEDYSNLDFCGVSNKDGITVSKYAAEDKIEDYKIIEKGCFAYNPYRINVGSIALLSEEKKGLISPAYVIFKTKPETIIDELLLKFLKSNEGLRQIKLYGRGTVRQALRFEDLCKIEISIPDLATQNELFYKLEIQQKAGDRILTELSDQLGLIDKLRQAFLREAMQGKLVPQDPNDEPASVLLEKIKAEKAKLIAEKKIQKQKPLPEIKPEEIPFEIPTNWTWCRLGNLTETITKGSSPKWQGINYVEDSNNGIFFVTSKNVGSYKLTLSAKQYVEKRFNEIEPRSILQKGDLLTNIVGASIGRTALYDLDEVANINQAVCLIRLGHDSVDRSFLLNYFNSELGTNQMFEHQFAPGRANLSMGDLANFFVPLPPLAEQKRIVEKLEKLMAYCDELEANIRESKQNAETLLQVALKEALEPK